jgi:VIT1/CCC1 family predicted Fe2+/Mn2+ transporter
MHVTQNAVIRDLAAGAAEGMTLSFALVAGLSGAGAAGPAILAAGLSVAAAAGIARSLGGWINARNEAEHHLAERRREEAETIDYPDRERWEVAAILHRYGVRGDALRLAVDSICADQRRWVDFMMRFELDLKEPEPRRATQSALSRGAAAVGGGLVPLTPFMLVEGVPIAFAVAAALAGLGLAGLGWLRAGATGLPGLRGALQQLGIGGAAGVAALLLSRLGGI